MTTAEIDAPLSDPSAWELRNARRAVREDRLQRISAEAHQVRFWHTMLLLVTGLIVGLAKLAGKGSRVFLVAFAHVVAAWKVGWQDGTGRGPTKSELLDQNRRMRLALERVGGDVPAMTYVQRGMPPE